LDAEADLQIMSMTKQKSIIKGDAQPAGLVMTKNNKGGKITNANDDIEDDEWNKSNLSDEQALDNLNVHDIKN